MMDPRVLQDDEFDTSIPLEAIKKQLLMGEIKFFIRRQMKKDFNLSSTSFTEMYKLARIQVRKQLLLRSFLVLILGIPFVFIAFLTLSFAAWAEIAAVALFSYFLLVFLGQWVMSYIDL